MTSTSVLERLAAFDTNTISDALDFLGLPGATFGLRPLWDCPKIVGRASTIQLGPKQGTAPTVHLISPVIADARSEHRKAATLPTSSIVTLRRSGAAFST